MSAIDHCRDSKGTDIDADLLYHVTRMLRYVT